MSSVTSNIALEQIYSSVCANRNENNISCRNGWLLYSRSRCPILYDLTNKQVAPLLIGHDDYVNGQNFVEYFDDSKSPSTDHIISTSQDKSAIIWQIHKNAICNQLEYKVLYRFQSPDDNAFVSRFSLKSKEDFISITTTLDEKLYLWTNSTLLQTVSLNYCCFNIKAHNVRMDETEFIFIFLAGSDNKVHVFHLSDHKMEHIIDLTGYNDWVKCMDTLNLIDTNNEFLLASGSQDSLVRVWYMKLVALDQIDPKHIRTISSKPICSNGQTFKLTATLETVLIGHGGIVHGLSWFKKQPGNLLRLLSCSEDKTIAIWQSSVANRDPNQRNNTKKYESCPASGEIWKETHRLGETGETNLPFLGVSLSEDENVFYATSLHGAIHRWSFDCNKAAWIIGESITGHFEPITDLCWEKSGAYLLTASLDKTCRMHAIATDDNEWHEITRPQVHGYSINAIASLNFVRFASGADEKTIRTFEGTKFFVENFKALVKEKLPDEVQSMSSELPAHAQLPALGLSNRGAQSPYDIADDKSASGCGDGWTETSNLVKELAQIDHLKQLPFEEILLQSTLWWETNKLFGHYNELHSLAVDSASSYLASASKANRSDFATIIVWETCKFRKVASIEHHSLTVTRMRFSPNDQYLLSVSRDRTWCLSKRTGQLRSAYKKLIGTQKSNAIHERIIWDCSWTFDSKYFMTVSRDKKAIIWSIEDIQHGDIQQDTIPFVAARNFDSSIQAVDSPSTGVVSVSDTSSTYYLFALAFEDGSLELHSIQLFTNAENSQAQQYQWQCLKCFANFHQLSIRRLAFQPTTTKDTRPGNSEALVLASGGDDCMVKLTRLVFK